MPENGSARRLSVFVSLKNNLVTAMIELQLVLRHMHIRRPLGKRFDKTYVVVIMIPPSLPSQMIWVAMSCRVAAGLYFIPPNTSMNGPKYVELLKEKLKMHMHVNGCTIVMLDSAPCHRSKVATEFLKINTISVLEWPGNSPDLNPIKNM